MKQTTPDLSTDHDSQAFADAADLPQCDLSGGRAVQFEFQARWRHPNMRVSQLLLDAVKERARASGIPHKRFIRQLMEREVAARKNRDNDREREKDDGHLIARVRTH